jgi:hypothetical protein
MFYVTNIPKYLNFATFSKDQLHHQNRPESEVSRLITVPLAFCGPPLLHILKESWNAMRMKHLFLLDQIE